MAGVDPPFGFNADRLPSQWFAMGIDNDLARFLLLDAAQSATFDTNGRCR